MAQAILFATEGGTSKETAEQIGKRTGINVVDIQEFPIGDIATYSFIIFVVPTYGEGEPPPSTESIWTDFLASTKSLTGLKYAVWGMGSTDFEATFLVFPKAIDAKLRELGATQVTALGHTDANGTDSDDLEEWLPKLGVKLV
jgi:sulfite reductase alpha subunit-like flavoprotein